MLRPAPADARDPLTLACFPLVPYANRVAHGRFGFEGQHYRLERNYPGQAHPLHGVGWLRPWQVADADGASAVLVYDHVGDAAWPWPYRAEQHVSLTSDGFAITLSVLAGDDMPVSLGLHPYLPRSPDTTLSFGATGLWEVDAELLPTACVTPDALGDWRRPRSLDRPGLIDNSYVGWDGIARIGRAGGDLILSATGTDVLHLYVPPDESFFCVEPVTAIPDALNRDPERLAAGERRTVTMALRFA